ncbi:hypothetical protein O7632_28615 [Solwaraspora sp. WMMD406]|uniref:hypothetical protein n=1 Tax=Solwaraspora sp. WMMD406 TaxID=3016095 RepID=UPI00241607F2|nr:hypothetical protein [Solwaraspora sp. WMMD406]MDG4768025.1 hypothetical protein [Solwaraspora sp. WMMD406]
MATLGVACTSSFAYLVVADGEAVVDGKPERLAFRDGLPEADQLVEFGKDVARALRDTGASEVVALRAASNYTDTHNGWTDRLAMETLLRLECAKAGVPCRYLSHQAVKGALGLAGRGGLATLGAGRVARSGRYWGEGRGLAALAAVAVEVGA